MRLKHAAGMANKKKKNQHSIEARIVICFDNKNISSSVYFHLNDISRHHFDCFLSLSLLMAIV